MNSKEEQPPEYQDKGMERVFNAYSAFVEKYIYIRLVSFWKPATVSGRLMKIILFLPLCCLQVCVEAMFWALHAFLFFVFLAAMVVVSSFEYLTEKCYGLYWYIKMGETKK